MKVQKKTVVAMAVALAFSAALAAQAQMSLTGLTNTNSKRVTTPTVTQTLVKTPTNSNKPADPPTGPIGTPGSDKTIKAHVEELEEAVAALNATVISLQNQINTLNTSLTSLQTQVNGIASDVAEIQANNALKLGPYVDVKLGKDNELAGPHVFFHGANVHIVSSSIDGPTYDFSGLGNLVIGGNEEPGGILAGDRAGSHNLVVGPGHIYRNSGGFVAGATNTITGKSASVTGGQNNAATNTGSSVSGGAFRNATGIDNWTAGGLHQTN